MPAKHKPSQSTAPIFFESAAAFRAWLQQHHAHAPELIVGYSRIKTGQPSMTWSDSVDQALCFGWIDGVRRSVDAGRYTIRFTPRRPGSIWSAINIKKIAALEEAGLMHPAGREAYARRTAKKSGIYAYEQRARARLTPELQRVLERDKKAWTFFQKQPPGYRQLTIFYVMDARQDDTRQRRLERVMSFWRRGERSR